MGEVALGSIVMKFVITESVVIGRNSWPGTRVSASSSSTLTNRPGASDGSPA
jgi:hypothetical protein